MSSKVTRLGPGTVTIGTAPLDFSCEMLGGAIRHEYEDGDEPRTTLCGTVIPGNATRTDGITLQLVNDLTATGLYAYLLAHDLEEAELVYTPNTVDGAKWAGTVQLRLPDELGADEFGGTIESEVSWTSTGLFTFTPAGAPAAASTKTK
jgi:hypothetical protein